MFNIYLEIISKKEYYNFERRHKKYLTSEKYKQRSKELLKKFFTNENGKIVNTIIIPYMSLHQHSLAQTDKEIIDYLNEHGYKCTEESYLLGYCLNDKNKEVSIVDVLKMIKQYNLEKLEKQKQENLQYSANYDKRIKAKQNFKENYLTYYQNFHKNTLKVIAFTWLPRAIASMSTNVGWRSCMNLHNGRYRNKVFPTIEAGAFIAWLVQKGDEEILDNPQARVLIKVYVTKNGKIFWHPSGSVYGTAPQDFHTKVKEFVIKKQEVYITDDDLEDVYEFDQEQYLDRDDIDKLSLKKIFNEKYQKLFERKLSGKTEITLNDLLYAIENKINIDTIKKILSSIPNKLTHKNYEEILNVAYKYHNIDFLQMMLYDLLNNEQFSKYIILLYAILINNIDIIKTLLVNKVDPSMNDNKAIKMATQMGYIEIVKLLLQDKRINVNNIISDLINIASKYGHIEIVKLLLHNLNIDQSDINNKTIEKAAEEATENRHIEIVKLLLQNQKTNLSTNSKFLNFLLKKAAEKGIVDVVKILLQNPKTDPSDYRNEAIKKATEYHHTEVVQILLQDKRIDPSIDNNYLIQKAAENGYADIVQLLLQDPRVNPSANYNHALDNAIKNGYLDVVKLLLQDSRTQPDQHIETSIKRALTNGHLEVIKFLLQHPKIDIHNIYNFIINESVEYGYTDIIQILLQNTQVDPSVNNNYAIQKAAKNGHTEIVKLLLQDKRVNPSDNDNYALQYAVENGHIEVIKLLLQDSRVRSTVNINDMIQLAQIKKNTEIIKLLQQYK